MLHVLRAFLAREVATYASYRAKMSLGVASMALSLVTFTFVGKVVASSGTGFADRFGMSYTSFAITGIFVHSLASSGLHAFKSAVRREQLQGTLELLMAGRSPAPALIVASGSTEILIRAMLGAALMAGVAAVAGVPLRLTPALVVAAGLYLAIAAGAGLASAGFILVSKEGDPVSWLFGGAASLLGGVFFPVEMLPSWVRGASRLLPTTHALEVARYGLVRSSAFGSGWGGAGLANSPAPPVVDSLIYLLTAAPVSMVAGVLILMWGLRRARREGTLGHY
jgi:ABC-2 type transport system permease protein